MKSRITKNLFFLVLMLTSDVAFGQSGQSGFSYFIYSLIGVAVLILLFLVVQVADNLLAVEAKSMGANDGKTNYSIFPRLGEVFAPKTPAFVGDSSVTFLKQGHDILLDGAPESTVIEEGTATTFALQPPNFIGLAPIPKVLVEVGDEVKAGDPIFFDKKVVDVKFVAPVSGEVIAVNRGEKRSIVEIVILADKEQKFKALPAFDLDQGSREELVAYLMENGAWPMFEQRPFNVIPAPGDVPRDIFISTFDTAPLAPDANVVVAGKEAAFQKGIDVLNKLTPGEVFLGLNAKGENAPAAAFTEAEGAVKSWFHGKHPAGNVGIQIHHTKPVGGQDKVWTLGVQEVIALGTMFLEGKYDGSRVVLVAGAEIGEPQYVRTAIGAKISDLLKEQNVAENVRYISGDVLSGRQKTADQFLNFHDDQLTVIAEGDYYELFGWLLPLSPRPSVSGTFPNFLFPDAKFKADTNTHGEKRAFVVTGQYEKVLPMDLYPQHLMKAILVNDFERMEGLGIYELAEEDVALCEFVCTSKQPLQQILREGLDTMREQM
ncbi:MAG: Na(+)-translocating NADH-quinone reductase subunit A [Saprospiraceae bacterium]|nr:Na(+)-translocating NADH-quinone reductase subunit A [Saprospiraceae bacterium]